MENKNNSQTVTACAFIHHNFDGVERVFVAKRADTKTFMPGVYELPGGHIESGEDPIDGLKREILEELGMHIVVADQFDEFSYTTDTPVIEKIYFATFEEPIENVKINRLDHASFLWIAENELKLIFSKEKGEKDPEIRSIKKGFKILQNLKMQ